jgi:hypothetical protein
MRVHAGGASVSWIPSEAVSGLMKAGFSTGLSHYDSPPPGEIGGLDSMGATLQTLCDQDTFRFANLIQAWVEFDGDEVVEYGQEGGVVMGATTVRVGPLGATFAGVTLPTLRDEPQIGAGRVTFTQVCGGRTAVPLPRKITRPPFFRLQSPVVWSTLTLTLHADGRSEIGISGASPFPRHWVYGPDGVVTLKAGTTDWPGWIGQPSWKRTPWGEEDSPVLVTLAETALERELSTLLMHGSDKPTIRTLAAGDVLATQGEPGSSLFLLLDGVLEVSVDGTPLVELGPGAVLGERAILEDGVRTSSLRAVTRLRLAEVAGSAIDREALARLAEGHRREERTT